MKKYIFLVASALSLAACTNDELGDSLENGPLPMRFIADVSAMNSRVNLYGTEFTKGDKVGIVPIKGGSVETSQNNLCYTLGADGVFSSDNPYRFRDRNPVTFNAYYPYRANLRDNEIKISTDAGEQYIDPMLGNWRNNDFLFASKTATVNSATVSFTGDNAFRHVMSKVTFKFKAGDDVDNLEGLSAYSLDYVYLAGRFNVVTGNVTADSRGGIPMNINSSAETEITATPLILIPQETQSITLAVTYKATRYIADLSGLSELGLTSLEPGKNYLFTVTINNTGMKVSQASIVDWVTETVFTMADM